MKEKIFVINLNDRAVQVEEYCLLDGAEYGRGLVRALVEENISEETDRYSEDNVIVIAPGLFSGCKAPSACRMFVATCEGRGKGMQICNTTGNMPQYLGSLGIAAIVIKGKSSQPGLVINIDESGVSFDEAPEYSEMHTSGIIRSIKDRHGQNSAVIGITKSGDMKMSLATFFCTYPDGNPEYHCPRNGWGDVWGAKNLRALVVNCQEIFGREVEDENRFWTTAKSITQDIVNDEICGSALPSYGSITIMKILKSRASVAELYSEKKGDTDNRNYVQDVSKENVARCSVKRNNLTCAPMCAIGCLNKHVSREGKPYHSPAQAEVEGALENCFGVTGYTLADEIQFRASEIGLVGTEFVTSCKVYAEAAGIENGQEHILEWLDEAEQGSLIGRVIASRTYGVASLYGDKQIDRWVDRQAIQDEPLFEIELDNKIEGLEWMNPLELLYSQIFVLENLGMCIFTSFALLNKADVFEKLAVMFEARTGLSQSSEQLIRYAYDCITKEKDFEEKLWRNAQKTNIPPFTKVLYRYFDTNR